MSLPKYPAYKDSGVEWLRSIPSHWEVVRLKNIFEIRKRIAGELGHSVLSITQRGIKVKDIESNDGQISMDYSKYQIVLPGDFAMNHMDLLTGYVDISSTHGVTSPDYRVFAMLDNAHCVPRYFLHLFQNGYRQKIFYAFGQGASEFGRWRFPTDQFNNFRLPCPPDDEQAAIATFLDRETAKIDALIAEQEKLIALLAEKRQATISHAVTRGLDPAVPMKDSGVEWLGQVPAHWVICSVRRKLKRIEQGWSPECFSRPAEAGEWGVLKAGCVNGGIFRPEENKALPDTLAPDENILIKDGDLLMSRASGSPALVGSVAYLSAPPAHLMLSDKIFRLHLEQGTLPQFVAIAFGARYLRHQIEQAISGAEGLANNLPQTSLKGFTIAIPPEVEQQEIVVFTQQETAKLDALKIAAEHAVSLLKERRAALIAAAVTGQIDVRGLVDAPASPAPEAA
ncbi:Type I restriction-modification system, S subunit [Laribacter hongkongensis HLHK9]|uniref:Type I restriction-modification system, S subunit n=1 Tax=Laribacter hongkongensis (strain HLHK9) TaxID=557598 RepID=C1D7R6_LARHH|nr:restriction endonuclease subunit S [Laribacter hongkongensis]ACO74506.1 Type I restriction-modification system, S subunit [Laribacter hongkongensis HLHK9]